MTVEKELEIIRKKNGGTLLPSQVVEYAENPESALHSRFEWDDGEAAKNYRLDQARHIIRAVVVVEPEAEMKRAYIHSTFKEESVYLPAARVLNNKSLRAQEVQAGFSELKKWLCKYEHVEEFSDVAAALSKFV